MTSANMTIYHIKDVKDLQVVLMTKKLNDKSEKGKLYTYIFRNIHNTGKNNNYNLASRQFLSFNWVSVLLRCIFGL